MLSQVSRQDNIHDIDLLNHHTVRLKLLVKLFSHGRRQLSFDISDSCNFDLFEEISDLLVTLLLQKLSQPVGPKIVEERLGLSFLYLLVLALPNMEVDTNIYRDTDIVFGRNMVYRAVESDGVFGDHRADSVLAATTVEVAASVPWLHDAIRLSVYLF